jgi:uncharacterized protein YjbI with pentapeptide repeats
VLPVLYFIGAVALGGSAAVFRHHVRTDRRDRRADTVVLVVAPAAGGLTFLAAAVQLTVEPGSELRYVLPTAAVCGGLATATFALWLNHRRYLIEEQRQDIESTKTDLERRKHDLDQFRVELERAKDLREHAKAADDVLLKVVELLGNSEHRVRAGALTALAGFAGQRPDRAADAVELICMYLRTAPSGDAVVRDAQRALVRVVRQANEAQPRLVPEVDLRHARLADLTLEHLDVAVLDLSQAHLSGTTSLRGLGGSGCVVRLDGAQCDGNVRLDGARLRELSAPRARIAADLVVLGAHVELAVELSDCEVYGDVDLSDSVLGSLTGLGANFRQLFAMRRTLLHGTATLGQTKFAEADFEHAAGPKLVLDEANVRRALRLTPAQWSTVSAWNTTIESGADRSKVRLPPGWEITADRRLILGIERDLIAQPTGRIEHAAPVGGTLHLGPPQPL